MFIFPLACQTLLTCPLPHTNIHLPLLRMINWNTFLSILGPNIHRPGRPRESLVLWVFGIWYDTDKKRTTIPQCATVYSCVRTSARKVYFYTWICFDVTCCTQMKTHLPLTHAHTRTHTTWHNVICIVTHTPSPESDTLYQFNLCSAPSCETETDANYSEDALPH